MEQYSPSSLYIVPKVSSSLWKKSVTKLLTSGILFKLWAYLSEVMREFVLIFNDMGKPSLEAKIHSEVR